MDDALAHVCELLERSAARYAIIGGHAVNAWLVPRFTRDIDITVAARPPGMQQLKDLLAREGFSVEREFGSDLPSGPDFVRLVSGDASIALEIQFAKTEFQHEVVRRAGEGGRRPCVATPEDLIIMKLIANRPKDMNDLRGLISLPAIDWEYVERWASQWQVTDTLRRLREGHGPC